MIGLNNDSEDLCECMLASSLLRVHFAQGPSQLVCCLLPGRRSSIDERSSFNLQHNETTLLPRQCSILIQSGVQLSTRAPALNANTTGFRKSESSRSIGWLVLPPPPVPLQSKATFSQVTRQDDRQQTGLSRIQMVYLIQTEQRAALLCHSPS
jgi:hypothetical protein